MITMEQRLKLLKQGYLKAGMPSYNLRMRHLNSIERWLKNHESDIYKALHMDLGKSDFESYETELMPLYQELNYYKKHLKKLMKDDKVKTSLMLFKAKSWIQKLPLGQVLILAPWNYPLQLSLLPLLSALAAGNTVILKPSELAPHTANLLIRMFREIDLDPYVGVMLGDGALANQLTAYPFDHIFFTGSPNVGKKVMENAAKNLVPVTLELGGKSPAIIDRNVDISLTAKRLIWGKYINAGQTCIAPDYVLVYESDAQEFIKHCIGFIEASVFANKDDYPKIINASHLERLQSYHDDKSWVYGGATIGLKLEPSIYLNPDSDSLMMQEEIFGPLLPIITYQDEEEIHSIVDPHKNPLVMYLFTESKEFQDRMMNSISSGGVCINDTLVHFANLNLPFGGKGNSGMGQYHGKAGFDTFTQNRPVMRRSTKTELSLRYPPYTDKLGLLKRITKFLK